MDRLSDSDVLLVRSNTMRIIGNQFDIWKGKGLGYFQLVFRLSQALYLHLEVGAWIEDNFVYFKTYYSRMADIDAHIEYMNRNSANKVFYFDQTNSVRV